MLGATPGAAAGRLAPSREPTRRRPCWAGCRGISSGKYHRTSRHWQSRAGCRRRAEDLRRAPVAMRSRWSPPSRRIPRDADGPSRTVDWTAGTHPLDLRLPARTTRPCSVKGHIRAFVTVEDRVDRLDHHAGRVAGDADARSACGRSPIPPQTTEMPRGTGTLWVTSIRMWAPLVIVGSLQSGSTVIMRRSYASYTRLVSWLMRRSPLSTPQSSRSRTPSSSARQ